MELYDNCGSRAIIVGLSDSGEKIPAAAGRISTQQGSATEIFEKSQDAEKNATLINRVTKSGHRSTVEHCVFNLAFQNVSVFAEQFIIEFRLASFTVKSRRYVDFGNPDYFTPALMDSNREIYKNTMDSLYEDYNFLIEKGVQREDARFVLPYCLRSNFYCTVNARELLHMLDAMLNGRGSRFAEIKNLGMQLYQRASALTPGIFSGFSVREAKNCESAPHTEKIAPEHTGDFKPVELLSCTPDARALIARTYLICSAQADTDEINSILADEKRLDDVIREIIESERPRALECAQYTFRINNVSLAAITHFTRHRIHSLQVPSLTQTNRKNFIIPPCVRENQEILDRYLHSFEKINTLYDTLKTSGESDDALVYCQLSGNTLDIVSTMNARQLLLFFKLRTCNRAQWEIRALATEMLMQLRQEDKGLFSFYGPSCFVGKCPEGRLSCGKMDEVRRFFS